MLIKSYANSTSTEDMFFWHSNISSQNQQPKKYFSSFFSSSIFFPFQLLYFSLLINLGSIWFMDIDLLTTIGGYYWNLIISGLIFQLFHGKNLQELLTNSFVLLSCHILNFFILHFPRTWEYHFLISCYKNIIFIKKSPFADSL